MANDKTSEPEAKEPKGDEDLLRQGREAFTRCKDAEDHNRDTALEDIKFARLGEQWPSAIIKQRELEHRPCLTINKLPAFIRQVVNDARQNKPSIKVHPADSAADVETAEIMNGLIRNIEYSSNADVAYDTAVECAVGGGFGYFRIGLDYAFDDTFDMDITIERVANPFAIYGDPNSTSADSSDWDVAFVVDRMAKSEYKRKYKGKAAVDWDDTDAWSEAGDDWRDDETVMIAEWWMREEVERTIVKLDDGRVFDKDALAEDEDLQFGLSSGLLTIVGERKTKGHKVTQRIMSGAEILETNEWPGKFIPIVPVYGDEFDIEGKRYLRSLIHSAKDAQRMFNYWRTTSTELVALSPRVPYLGEEGAFDVDDNWSTANTVSHPYLEYAKGSTPPQRQPLDMGVAAGALQEALNASDDMKSIIGLYDASLGARSNETSGKAIMARQREGDVATFHFIDNMARAIRHAGRIIIDLIPKVYDAPRIVRVIGEDGSEEAKQVNQPAPKIDRETGQPVREEVTDPNTGETFMQAVMAMHDLTVGKYDLTVTTGPSFTTRREEAAAQMTEMIRAYPDAAPYIADILAKNFDWPGADEIAERFKAMRPQQGQQGLPPEVQKGLQQMQQQLQQLSQENQTLKMDQQNKTAELLVKKFEAETSRMQVMQQGQKAQADVQIQGFEAALSARAMQADPNPQYSR
jgi:hypothetical protein